MKGQERSPPTSRVNPALQSKGRPHQLTVKLTFVSPLLCVWGRVEGGRFSLCIQAGLKLTVLPQPPKYCGHMDNHSWLSEKSMEGATEANLPCLLDALVRIPRELPVNPPTGTIRLVTIPSFPCRCWRLNTGPHDCTAKHLTDLNCLLSLFMS